MSDIIEENQQQIEQNEETSPQEQPFLVTSYKIDGNAQREFSKPLLIYSYIAMPVGLPLVIGYIVLSLLSDEGILVGLPAAIPYVLLFVGAVLFATGLVFLFTVRKNIRNAENLIQTNEYSFYEDYMCVESICRGERVGVAKVYYNDLAKRRERRDFFLLYPNSVSVFPVPKSGLSEEEIAHLRNALRIIKR